jgi:hypothetical protein
MMRFYKTANSCTIYSFSHTKKDIIDQGQDPDPQLCLKMLRKNAAGCRNADAGVSFLDADAHLCLPAFSSMRALWCNLSCE